MRIRIILALVIALALLTLTACTSSALTGGNIPEPEPPLLVKATNPIPIQVALQEQIILDEFANSDEKVKLERYGERIIEGIECYRYSLYIEMEQDDGTQAHHAFRRVSECAISKSGEKVFTSADGEEWELRTFLSNSEKPSTKNFYELVEKYRAGGNLVVDSAYGDTMENTILLTCWVSTYKQQEYASTVAIFLDAQGMGDVLYTLECNGGPEYTITEYTNIDGLLAANVYKSSTVIERAYDYVFGADIPLKERRYAIVLHRNIPVAFAETEIQELRQLYEITPAEAESRAKAVETHLIASESAGYAGGYYLKIDTVNPPIQVYSQPDFKAAGIIRLDDCLCYLVYGGFDKAALERGEHGGIVYAVSADGALVFTQRVEGGEWIFVDDANQVAYPGTWPYIEDFETKAKALGYSDAQLEFMAENDRGSANTVLNLSKQIGLNFKKEYGRYELGGYLCIVGNEFGASIRFVRDTETGRVTILPDIYYDHDEQIFMDETTFYAEMPGIKDADNEIGVLFYNADSPAKPFARWDVTDESVSSDTDKRLLNVYYDEVNGLLAAFWCETPTEWGGWVKEDTQTYQVTVLDKWGNVENSFDTGVKLVGSRFGVVYPNFGKPNANPHPLTHTVYFGIDNDGYSLNLETGEIAKVYH